MSIGDVKVPTEEARWAVEVHLEDGWVRIPYPPEDAPRRQIMELGSVMGFATVLAFGKSDQQRALFRVAARKYRDAWHPSLVIGAPSAPPAAPA